jgi:hypothetical protein
MKKYFSNLLALKDDDRIAKARRANYGESVCGKRAICGKLSLCSVNCANSASCCVLGTAGEVRSSNLKLRSKIDEGKGNKALAAGRIGTPAFRKLCPRA